MALINQFESVVRIWERLCQRLKHQNVIQHSGTF